MIKDRTKKEFSTRFKKSTTGTRFRIVLFSLGFLAVFYSYVEVRAAIERANISVADEKQEQGKAGTKAAAKKKPAKQSFITDKVEMKLIQSIDKTMAFYKKEASKRKKGSADRLKMLMRLLNLHKEQATYVSKQEEISYEKAYDRWEAGGNKGPEPKRNTSKSTKNWKAVMNLATDITKEYPRNPEGVKVMEVNGIAHKGAGLDEDAARIFTQLIQKYPNATETGTAYHFLGEFYYDRLDFRNALTNYKHVLKYKKSSRYQRALYDIGWCYFNLGNHHMALKYWKQTVAYGKVRNDPSMGNAAMGDMVLSYAHLKDVNGAISYFRANSRPADFTGKLIKRLADELYDNGEQQEARRVYKILQKYAPSSPSAPEAQMAVIDIDYNAGKFPLMWKEIELLLKLYGPKSAWARANASNKELVLKTREDVSRIIIDKTGHIALRGKDASDSKLMAQALFGCNLFLQYFGGSNKAVQIKEWAADFNYDLKKYREAGKLYLSIASMKPQEALGMDFKTGKTINIHKKSADNMLFAYGDDFKPYYTKMQKLKPDFKKPTPIGIEAKNYIKACSKYMDLYPKEAKKIYTCENYLSEIYYYHGYREQATKYTTLIALKYPKTKAGPAAAETLIKLNSHDPAKCLELANKLLKIPEYRKGELGKKLRALQIDSEKQAVVAEKDSAKRAAKYEALAKKYPNDPEADTMWYNAGVEYIKAGNIPAGVGAYMSLIKKYPNSKQAQDVLMTIALIYKNRLEFMNASNYLKMYVKKYPKSPKAMGAMATSCELEIAYEAPSAIKTCQQGIIKADPSNPAYMEKLIILTDRTKKFANMVALINIYLKSYKLSANERIIAYNRIYSANPKSPEGQSASKSMLAEYSKNKKAVSGEAQRYAVEILFKNAAASIRPFMAAKLEGGTVDKLLASMQKKGALLQKVLASYDAVLATEDAYWGVGALHQKGAAFEEYAKALANPPAIKGASKEDILKELQPQINEFNKNALASYSAAVDLVTKFNVYNEWSIRALNSKSRVTGSSLKLEDYVFSPDFVGSQVSSSILSVL